MKNYRQYIFAALIAACAHGSNAQNGYQPSGALGAVYDGMERANQQNQADLQRIQSQLQLLRQIEEIKRQKQENEARATAEREKQAQLEELLRNPVKLYQIGLNAAQANDFSMALDAFSRSANLGHPPAQMALGVMYEVGKGVAQDYRIAFGWYKKAADAGDAFSQFKVGSAFAYGRGVEQDEKVAIYWFTLAAKQGFTGAQSELGSRYVLGRGTEVNLSEALNWSLKAAYKGDATAQMVCGVVYLKGYSGQPPNRQEGIEWLTKSAAQGNDAAIELLKEAKKQPVKKSGAKKNS